jgi:DMSO reductase anchor subunit
LSRAEGRRFGLTVGGAFLALTALVWWRGRQDVVPYLGTLSALLIAAGLLAPTTLGPVRRAWMALSRLLSKVTTPIFMGVVYFLVVTPTGAIMRLLGRHTLVHEATDGSFWTAHTGVSDPKQMKRQF